MECVGRRRGLVSAAQGENTLARRHRILLSLALAAPHGLILGRSSTRRRPRNVCPVDGVVGAPGKAGEFQELFLGEKRSVSVCDFPATGILSLTPWRMVLIFFLARLVARF